MCVPCNTWSTTKVGEDNLPAIVFNVTKFLYDRCLQHELVGNTELGDAVMVVKEVGNL